VTRQFTLAIGLDACIRLDDFLPFDPPSRLARALCEAVAVGVEPQALLYGPPGSGKSHLLQASCTAALEAGHTAAYLPLRRLARLGPGVLEGAESAWLLCLDDLDAVITEAAWAEALYALIELARLGGRRLLVSAGLALDALRCPLPDLESRLTAGPVVALDPPPVRLHAELRRRFRHRTGLDPASPGGRGLPPPLDA